MLESSSSELKIRSGKASSAEMPSLHVARGIATTVKMKPPGNVDGRLPLETLKSSKTAGGESSVVFDSLPCDESLVM